MQKMFNCDHCDQYGFCRKYSNLEASVMCPGNGDCTDEEIEYTLDNLPTVDAVEVDYAVTCAIQLVLEAIRQYRRYIGDDPVFDFTQKELEELSGYAIYLMGAKMDGGNEDG